MFVILGSFSEAMTIWRFHEDSRRLEYHSSCPLTGPAPSWLSLLSLLGHTGSSSGDNANSASGRSVAQREGYYLLCTNEVDDFEGEDTTGAVSVFRLKLNRECTEEKQKEDSISLDFLNRTSTFGGWPCHLAVHETTEASSNSCTSVYVANYKSGTFARLQPIWRQDTLETVIAGLLPVEPGQCIDHRIDAPEDSIPHAHQIVVSGPNTIAVTDLGLNQIRQYYIDPSSGALVSTTAFNTVTLPMGSGPRHLAIHPSYPLTFVLCEQGNTLIPLRFDRATGTISHFEQSDNNTLQYSTLVDTAGDPFPRTDLMGAAHIQLSPNGRFIYISNRDISPEDLHRSSISVFAIADAEMGTLRHLQTCYSGGKHPRHFALVRDGNLLLVANKDSRNVVAFTVNADTGVIDETSAVATEAEQINNPSFVLCIE